MDQLTKPHTLSFADTLVFITVILFILCVIAGAIYLLIVMCDTRDSPKDRQPGHLFEQRPHPVQPVVSVTTHVPETRVHPYFRMKPIFAAR